MPLAIAPHPDPRPALARASGEREGPASEARID